MGAYSMCPMCSVLYMNVLGQPPKEPPETVAFPSHRGDGGSTRAHIARFQMSRSFPPQALDITQQDIVNMQIGPGSPSALTHSSHRYLPSMGYVPGTGLGTTGSPNRAVPALMEFAAPHGNTEDQEGSKSPANIKLHLW